MFRNQYTKLWLLLLCALLVILFIAFFDDIKIGSYTIKKAPIADALNKVHPDTDLIEEADTVQMADIEIKTDSLPQSIFIFGDSMTHNLGLRLAQYAKYNGHTIHTVNWDSSNTKIWGESDTLAYFIKKYRPTQIFIALGSNELLLPKPETRKEYIKKILSVIDTIPYVWIGPPNWKEDTGINKLLASECKRGSFFLSDGMEFQRGPDKVHPTRRSAALWMDSIMRWMPNSYHPIVMDLPPDSIGFVSSNVVFLKALNK